MARYFFANALMAFSEKTRAFAASARVANAPSVVVNVWLGIAIALSSAAPQPPVEIWIPAAWLSLSGLLLYVAGNFLNDWADRAWDSIHRPERALPRGIFPPPFYLLLAIACGILGLGFSALTQLTSLTVAGIIGALIILYTWTHKRSAWSVIPMACCRAGLPVLGFFGFQTGANHASSALALAAAGLFSHIAGLSISARNESSNHARTGRSTASILLFGGAVAAMSSLSLLHLKAPAQLVTIGAVPYLAWLTLAFTIFRKPVRAHVSSLLAGIPLVDWIVLIPLSFQLPAPFSTLCFCLPPLAFLTARMLQRVAPAT
jgi:4-hydroxybenzoate polyprenyltransferase